METVLQYETNACAKYGSGLNLILKYQYVPTLMYVNTLNTCTHIKCLQIWNLIMQAWLKDVSRGQRRNRDSVYAIQDTIYRIYTIYRIDLRKVPYIASLHAECRSIIK